MYIIFTSPSTGFLLFFFNFHFYKCFFFFFLATLTLFLHSLTHQLVGLEKDSQTGYSEQLNTKPALLLYPSISVNEPLCQLCYMKHHIQQQKSTHSSNSASRSRYEPVVFTVTLLTETNHSAFPCKFFSMKTGTEKQRRCYFLLQRNQIARHHKAIYLAALQADYAHHVFFVLTSSRNIDYEYQRKDPRLLPVASPHIANILFIIEPVSSFSPTHCLSCLRVSIVEIVENSCSRKSVLVETWFQAAKPFFQ